MDFHGFTLPILCRSCAVPKKFPGSPGPAASPVQASRGVGVGVSNGIYDGMSEMDRNGSIIYNPVIKVAW